MNKKLLSVATLAMLVVGLLFAGGCTAKVTEEQANVMVQSALTQQQAAFEAKLAVVQDKLNGLQAEKDLLAAAKAEAEAKQAALEANKTAQEVKVTDLQALIDQMKAEKESAVDKYDSGKGYDDLELGETLSKSLDDSDIESLADEDISFAGDDYATHEEFNMRLEVGFSGDDAYDKDFSSEPYLVGQNKGDLSYMLVFDDAIDMDDIDSDEPLEVRFLGRTLRIVSADSDSITVEDGDRYSLVEGETLTIDGKTVTLVSASETKALIKVGSEQKIVSEDDNEEIGNLDIRLDEAISTSRSGYAEIVVGNDVRRTIDDGDEWVKDDERFIFTMVTSGSDLESIGISFDQRFDDLSDDYEPLAVGDALSFPNDYITVAFESTNEPKYEDYSIDFDRIDTGAIDELVTVLKGNYLSVDGEDASEVYFLSDSSVWYKNDENDEVESISDAAVIEYKDTTLDVVVSGGLLTITDEDGNVLSFDARADSETLGASDDAEATDIVYNGQTFGTLDGDLLTHYGIVVSDVNDNADSNRVEFSVPSERLTATVFVSVAD